MPNQYQINPSTGPCIVNLMCIIYTHCLCATVWIAVRALVQTIYTTHIHRYRTLFNMWGVLYEPPPKQTYTNTNNNEHERTVQALAAVMSRIKMCATVDGQRCTVTRACTSSPQHVKGYKYYAMRRIMIL